MKNWKELGKALLFPHIAIMISLLPIAIVLLVGSMVFIGTESTMLTVFGNETMSATAQKWILGVTGGAISALIVVIAIYMIAFGTKKLKKLNIEVENG